MAYEIELKARVEAREAVKKRLSGLGVWGGSYSKDDCYWKPVADTDTLPASGVRVRRETRKLPEGTIAAACLVTFKTKENRDGIEVNEENEFTVSDGETFSALLSRLGLYEDYRKTKTGEVWTVDGTITAELAEVGDSRCSLGIFLELEIIADRTEPETIATARARLLKLLADCGLGEDRIESRYYAEMLRSGSADVCNRQRIND
jgi:adenylate cyclase class 2